MPERGKRSERSWVIQLIYDEYGTVLNRNEVRQAFEDAEAIGFRLGGIVNACPIRQRREETGEFVTTGWLFEWASYAPAVTPPTGGDLLPEEPPMQPPVEEVVEPELTGAEKADDDELTERLQEREAKQPSAA